MRNSLDVSAPGHSPWILDWACYLRTPLCHVYIPYQDILQGVPGFFTNMVELQSQHGLVITCIMWDEITYPFLKSSGMDK